MQDKQDPLDHLELPKTDLRSIAQNFGPGLILMMTGIGTSHLVTAPAAGGPGRVLGALACEMRGRWLH